jgi:hypothetical protein
VEIPGACFRQKTGMFDLGDTFYCFCWQQNCFNNILKRNEHHLEQKKLKKFPAKTRVDVYPGGRYDWEDIGFTAAQPMPGNEEVTCSK